MEKNPIAIEHYFLNIILRISIGGVILILLSNLIFFPEDSLSIYMAIVILTACIIAYSLRKKYPIVSVLIVTSITLIGMSYQRWVTPQTTTTLSVVMIVGFMFSVMLKGRLMWFMHSISAILLIVIFAWPMKDTVTAGITYLTLYFVLIFATAKLKAAYDKGQKNLMEINEELKSKTDEIISRNEELQQIQDNLSQLNKELETRVSERTAQIRRQNEILIRYSYANAHHLRGPVARLLGLASVIRIEKNPDHEFYIDKMVEQAKEIDEVVKQINIELADNEL